MFLFLHLVKPANDEGGFVKYPFENLSCFLRPSWVTGSLGGAASRIWFIRIRLTNTVTAVVIQSQPDQSRLQKSRPHQKWLNTGHF